MRDPHVVLGVGANASMREIKSAYRTLAKRWHPDRHGGDADARARFVEISDAYRLLITPERARRPDRPQRRRASSRSGSTAPEQGSGFAAADETDEAMMERIFGVSPARVHVDDAPGLDSVEADLPIDDDAPVDVDAPRQNRRTVRLALNAIFGRRRAAMEGGGDVILPDPAPQSRRVEADLFDVSVPLTLIASGGSFDVPGPDGSLVSLEITRGMPDGTRLKLPAPQGSARPVEAVVRYAVSDVLWNDGDGLHAVLAIDLDTAVLGGKVQVATLDGAIRLTVPPWSGSDRVLKVAGRGLPSPDEKPRGDLFVHMRVLLGQNPDTDIVALMKARRQSCHV